MKEIVKMRNLRTSQRGFALIEIILVVAILAVIGFVGWSFYNSLQNQQANDTSTTEQTSATQPPEVETSDDLKKASEFITKTDIDKQLDTSEIDSALSE